MTDQVSGKIISNVLLILMFLEGRRGQQIPNGLPKGEAAVVPL
jgi:hypothetical protein